jgi:Fur family zinc uptake transcriptional regulator
LIFESDVIRFLSRVQVQGKGQKLTPIRRKVLHLLLESEEPAKAYDLLANLDGEGSPKPPTVYRALDFLQEMGLAHKIESLNAYVACGHASHAHSAVFLICDRCGNVTEIQSDALHDALISQAKQRGFMVEQQTIEAHGFCEQCR